MSASRALRRHHRERVKARHLAYWRMSNGEEQPPRDIAKRHPADCGKGDCGICHRERRGRPLSAPPTGCPR